MHSTFFVGANVLGPIGEWWADTLVRAFTAPLWLAPGPQTENAQALPAGSAPIEFRALGGEPRRVADRALVQRAGESERLRIAQQVHDDLGGVLTGLRACVVVSQERAALAGRQPDPLLDDARALAELAFHAVRNVATDVRPVILDQLGVWAALDWHLGKLARRSSMHCDLHVDEELAQSDLGRARELAIYRIVQEAVTNVERHACAWQLLISATRSPSELLMTVTDDGVGIGQSGRGRDGALGIRGMVEQARAFGGSLTIKSRQNKGTVVHLALPLGNADVS